MDAARHYVQQSRFRARFHPDPIGYRPLRVKEKAQLPKNLDGDCHEHENAFITLWQLHAFQTV